MVVVVIIDILVAIAVPVFSNVQTNARRNAHNANVRTLQGAATMMLAEQSPLAAEVRWPETTNAPTGWNGYLGEWPTNPLSPTAAYTVTISVAGAVYVTPGMAP